MTSFLKKRLKSFGYAIKGLGLFYKTQTHAWVHSLAAITAVVLGFILKINTTEWVLILIAIGLVFTAEIFNTAIEFLVDWVSPEHHVKAKQVKDLAAASVLFSSLTALIIGFFVFVL